MGKKFILLGITVILSAIAVTTNNFIGICGGIVGLIIAVFGIFIQDNDVK